jgi:hypothetical protein
VYFCSPIVGAAQTLLSLTQACSTTYVSLATLGKFDLHAVKVKVKVKVKTKQPLYRPEDPRRFRFPNFMTIST